MRLQPGDDLRVALAAVLQEQGEKAACIVSGIGSFSQAMLRYAGEEQGTHLAGPLELLSLAGTLSLGGPHLHASVSDAQGQVHGGHVMQGCIVRTTAEIVLGLLPGWAFGRQLDPATGYPELVARRAG
nr:PPC domain-containing DNA-binding protein [Ramlibacter agri]